jgi:hypothetical protein
MTIDREHAAQVGSAPVVYHAMCHPTIIQPKEPSDTIRPPDRVAPLLSTGAN